jgi:mannosyl-oligosaccharide alpha-1,2-mannosidase
MKMLTRWRLRLGCLALLLLLLLFLQKSRRDESYNSNSKFPYEDVHSADLQHDDGKLNWARVPHRYRVPSIRPLPSPRPGNIPKVQARFARESRGQRGIRLQRLAAVRGNFTHAWQGYKTHAWLRDEVAPLSGEPLDHFGGWAATLVDSLGKLETSLNSF